ncbi:calcium-binding protein [Qipengyuania vulgaris]
MAAGARNFRLSQMKAGDRISGFEQITLQANQNLSIDDKSAASLAGVTPLRIEAGASNSIHLDGAWTRAVDRTVDGVLYEAWTKGNVTVLVTETATVTANSSPGYGGFDAVAGGTSAPRAGSAAGLDYSSSVNYLSGHSVRDSEFSVETEEVFYSQGPSVFVLHASNGTLMSTLVNHGEVYSIQEFYSAASAVESTGNSRVENYGIITAEQYAPLGEEVFYYPTIALQLSTYSEIVNTGEILAYSTAGSAIATNLGSWFENSGAIYAISEFSRAIGVNEIFSENLNEHHQTFFNTGLIYAEAGGTGRQAWVENDSLVPEDIAATGVAAYGSLVNDGDIHAVLGVTADPSLETVGVLLVPLYQQFDRSYGVTNNGTIEGVNAIEFWNRDHHTFHLYNGYYRYHNYWVENNGLLLGNVLFEGGNDEYDGRNGQVTGTVFGMRGDDVMLGGAFDDSFEGGAGSDILRGGAGSDTASYSQASSAVTVSLAIAASQNTQGAGSDLLESIENLTGSAFSDKLRGDSQANVLIGLAGADRLFGNGGEDSLDGGVGNDFLFGGQGDDVISGGSGRDQLYGEDGDDTLLGGDGNDVFFGGAGADHMEGGAGSDTYFVDNVGDVVVEVAGGYNTVESSVDFVLPDHTHKLVLSGAARAGTGNDRYNTIRGSANDDTVSGLNGNDVLIGNDGNDVLLGGRDSDEMFGGSGADKLDGGSHSDVLWGGGGDDTLLGGDGADKLDGGAGRDLFSGGAGADIFLFRNASDMGSSAATADRISDFSRAQGDKINLWSIDANATLAGNQAFTFIGTSAFGNVVGQMRYVSDGTGGVIVQLDTNGDGVADHFLALSNVTDLQSSDLVL